MVDKRQARRERARGGTRLTEAQASAVVDLAPDLRDLADAAGMPRQRAALCRVQRAVLDSGGGSVLLRPGDVRALRRVLAALSGDRADLARVARWIGA